MVTARLRFHAELNGFLPRRAAPRRDRYRYRRRDLFASCARSGVDQGTDQGRGRAPLM